MHIWRFELIYSTSTDYLLPAMVSGHDGCITGTGNVIPKTIVKLYETANEALTTGDAAKMKEAQRLQHIVTNADWCIIKVSLALGSAGRLR